MRKTHNANVPHRVGTPGRSNTDTVVGVAGYLVNDGRQT